jgi:hypothetical protein
VLAAGLIVASPAGAEPQRIARHFTARDQQVERYVYVPFEVPPGTTRVVVSYRYDRRDGTNVVDLGLYEPGSLALGSGTCRGWSGGERETVSIGIDEATPGYWPGPIPAGQWSVGLGLYKVAPDGVDVEVTVETSSAPVTADVPALAPRAAEPIRRGAAWYVGALHAHTTNSDGALTPQQLAEKARQEKLDFLAITDHNNTAHQLAPIDVPDLLLIVGEEVTTPGGHFNVWGIGGFRDQIDFRVLAGDPGLTALVSAAHARGALVSINHPASTCVACVWTHPVPGDVTAMEISDERPESRLQALALWDALLRQGRRVTAVATSDWHRGTSPLGVPAVRVRADELSTAAILAGIRAGRVVIVADGALPVPDVVATSGTATARIGDTMRVARGAAMGVTVTLAPEYGEAQVELWWNGERVAAGRAAAGGTVTFDRYGRQSGYLRVHVTRPDGTPLAVTNPMFIEVPAP